MVNIEIDGTYIQYAAGYNKDDISLSDLEKALNDIHDMDDEHGCFWVGVHGADTDEIVLELHKNKTLFGCFGEYENYKIKLDKLELAKGSFKLLLSGRIDELKEKFNNNV